MNGGGAGAALSRAEAARLVASLRAFSPSDVGGAAWWAQRRCVERLNAGAHAQGAAAAAAVAAAVAAAAPASLDALVRELILAEAWRDRVAAHLGAGGDAARLCSYLALYHEAVLSNLLEYLCLHCDAADVAGEDALLELADYAVRSALFLTTDEGRQAAAHETSPKALLDAAGGAELAAGGRDARLGAALSGLAVLRCLAQRCEALPPGVRARLLRAADAPAALARLLSAKPWARALGGGRMQVFEGGAWADTAATSAAPLHAAEGHAWLALLALLAGGPSAGYPPAAQARALAAARRLLTPRVLDALPALTWLQRAAELADLSAQQSSAGDAYGAAAGVNTAAADARPSLLLLETLPPWRAPLLSGTDWAGVVSAAKGGVFGDTPAAAQAAAREAAAAAALWDEALLLPEQPAAADVAAPRSTKASTSAAAAASPALPQPVLLAVARRDAGGDWAPSWEAALQADPSAPPADVALRDTSASSASSPSDAPTVTGRRWRLLPPSAPRRVPPGARLRCSLGAAEAVIDLSAPLAVPGAAPVSDADWAAAAPVLWVTLGSLVRDGFALQLRLARVESPGLAGVDGATGAAMLYRMAGGALTLRC